MNRSIIRRAGVVVAAGLIAVAAFAAVQDISLKRKPKVGDVSEFKVNATFTADAGEITFTQKRVEKVTDVKPDNGFVVESTASETKITLGGNDIGAQQDVTASAEYGPDGMLRSVKSEAAPDASSYRIANLHAFKAPDGPVKVGDEIKFDIPADAKKMTPAVKMTYKVVAKEKFKDWDAVKLTYSAEETEGDTKSSIKGSIWLSTADGSMIKTDETWKDVQPQGAPFPVSGKYSVERVK